MGELVSLRRARKAKGRVAAEAQAATNRAAFGRTKAQRALDAEERRRVARELDGARREP